MERPRVPGRQNGEAPEYQVDLEAFYLSTGHRRWFFGLLIGFWVEFTVADQLTFESGGLAQRLRSVLLVVGLCAVTAVPILTDRRWAHWIVVTLLGGLIGAEAVQDILLWAGAELATAFESALSKSVLVPDPHSLQLERGRQEHH